MNNTTVVQSMINAIDKPAIFITPDYVIHAVNQAYRETYDADVINAIKSLITVTNLAINTVRNARYYNARVLTELPVQCIFTAQCKVSLTATF